MIRINYEYTRQSIYENKPKSYKHLLKLISDNFDKNIKNLLIFSLNFYKNSIFRINDENTLKFFYDNSEFYNELFITDNNIISSQYESLQQKYYFEMKRQRSIQSKNNIKIDSLEKEQEKLKKEIKDKLDTIKNLNIEIEEYKKNKYYLESKARKEMNELETKKNNQIAKLSNELNEKKNEIDELNDKIIEKDNRINNLNVAINSSEITLHKLKRNNLIKKVEIKENVNKDLIPQYDDKNPLDFYDIIADINSIKEIVDGWEILMNENGKEKFNKIEDNSVKIGVIGNGNKGKSFLLSKISDFDLPIGTSIKTKGLSFKFPDLKKYINKNIILIDSAGQETPVLDNNKNNNNSSNKRTKEGENKELLEQERLTEKSRDKLFTEFFLQNYIIKYSDLLILVVGILTFSEQKLINKVKRSFASLNKKSPLIIVHNLQSYVTKKQVKDYIKNTLLKSDTFDLKEDKKISKEKNEIEWTYFYEPDSNTNHLIYAREESEAGDFYNKETISKIYELINSINNKEPLNLSENIKELFFDLSSDILETSIKKEDIIQEKGKVKLKIKDKNELKLKKCSIDELGLNKFSSSRFEPKYCYYINGNELKIICEIPGLDRDSFDCKPYCQNGKFTATIKGQKINDLANLENQNIKKTNNREFGDFKLTIKIDNVNIDGSNGVLEYNDGLVCITYKLKTEMNSLKIKNKNKSQTIYFPKNKNSKIY